MKQPQTLPIAEAASLGLGFEDLLGCFHCGELPEVEQPTYGIWKGFTIISCPNRCHEEYALDVVVVKFFWNEWAGMRDYSKQPNADLRQDASSAASNVK